MIKMPSVILNLMRVQPVLPRSVRVGRPVNRNMGSVSAPFTFVVTISCATDTEEKRKTLAHV